MISSRFGLSYQKQYYPPFPYPSLPAFVYRTHPAALTDPSAKGQTLFTTISQAKPSIHSIALQLLASFVPHSILKKNLRRTHLFAVIILNGCGILDWGAYVCPGYPNDRASV